MVIIIVLTGKTTAGKDSIQKELSRVCGMNKVVNYTTRPKRPHETDGIEYHFISEDEFMKKVKEGFFAEVTHYDVVEGQRWFYGTSKESLLNEDAVIILNPAGLKFLKTQPGLDLTVFYIHSNEEVIRGRLIQRGDNPTEAERRLAADNEDFKNIEDYYNYAIENNGRKSPTILAEEIWLIYKTEKRLLEDLHDRENSN